MSRLKRIKRNAAQCKVCGEVVESKWRNNHVTCSCGNLSVDGGHDYIRRGFRNGKDSFENMNEFGVDILPTYGCCPGWWRMLDCELKEFYEVDPELTEVRVKEKYGRADVDCFTETETRWDLLGMCDDILSRVSQETCELCGKYGRVRNENGWLQCRCDRCNKASREEQTEIMRKTAEAYEKAIDEMLPMELADIELTERDKASLRYGVWHRGEFDAIVSRILREANLKGSESQEEC